MEEEQKYLTKEDTIKQYSPMFTEWSLSKLIREKKIKTIRIGRRIFINKDTIEEFIKNQEETSILKEQGGIHLV